MNTHLPKNVCQSCHSDLESYVTADAFGTETDVDPPPELDPCDICGEELGGDSYYSLTSINCRDDLAKQIQNQIYKCDGDGCGKVYDKEGEVFDDTNTTVYDAFAEVVKELKEKDTYEKLLHRLSDDGNLDQVELPDLVCDTCGSAIESWHQEIKAQVYHLLLPEVPELPDEISKIPSAASNPADVIEYFRSDCSNVLIHLTKGAKLAYRINNIDETEETKLFRAKEVLYLILTSKTLRVAEGKGLHAPAVCFTEKPLTALKDTLLGNEATVRGERKAIKWQPYGLMFSKEYLQRFGTSPVLHLTQTEEDAIPKEMTHRIVRFSPGSNWQHEREWRCGQDIEFDPAEAIVLVPRFEQIDAFRDSLQRAGIRVKGYLPLLDLFACI